MQARLEVVLHASRVHSGVRLSSPSASLNSSWLGDLALQLQKMPKKTCVFWKVTKTSLASRSVGGSTRYWYHTTLDQYPLPYEVALGISPSSLRSLYKSLVFWHSFSPMKDETEFPSHFLEEPELLSLCALVGVSLEPCPYYTRYWSLRPPCCAEI